MRSNRCGSRTRTAAPDPRTDPGTGLPFLATDRGLLLGTTIGTSAVLAAGWCLVIGLVSYRWALKLYNRDPWR
jgi:hypothetical protein